MTAISLRDVTKRFGRLAAVEELSLTVPEGCVFGFIGPNASGKTTTIILMYGKSATFPEMLRWIRAV